MDQDLEIDITSRILAKTNAIIKKKSKTALIFLDEGAYAFLNTKDAEIFVAQTKGIIGAQKFKYDDSVFALIERTASIDTEELLANLDKISFPFDRLWLTGPSTPGDPQRDFKWLGYLIETDNIQHSFKFQRYLAAENGFGDKGVYVNKVTVTVSKDGISFNDDKLMHELEYLQKRVTQEFDKGGVDQTLLEATKAKLDKWLAAEIDTLNNAADFLARLFVCISADKKPLAGANPRALKDEEKTNRQRRRMGLADKVTVPPLLIDLSADTFPARKLDAKGLRKLLGWTDVRRSKPIVSKYGKVFTRKPHDRRILADEDRRGRTRTLVASKVDMELSFGPVRPALTSKLPESKL